jgi:hypothetical protein
LIAGVGAIALLIALFWPWLGVSDITSEAAEGLGVQADLPTTNAWESFTFLDLALLVPVVSGLLLGAFAAVGAQGGLPPAAGLVVAAVGGLAALAILYRIIEPLKDASLEYGIWVGLAASIVIAVGGAITVRRGGTR